MNYLYYPGCSLKCSGRGYEESLLPVFEALGASLEELPDWNCCGATAYMSVDQHAAYGLALRNLALAERRAGAGEAPVDLVAPCAACYLVLHRAQHYITEYPEFGRQMAERLKIAGLRYTGRVRVRHPLDVLVNEIGLGRIRSRVRRPLTGLKAVCYYGCQIVRPYALFDDQDRPTSMDLLMSALGAEPLDWPLKTRCCGGSLTGTIPDVGLRLNELLLNEARSRGAQAVVTACPLCQFNLECKEGGSPRRRGEGEHLQIVYFTQLAGVAFGIPERKLGLQRSLVPFRCDLVAPEGASHA